MTPARTPRTEAPPSAAPSSATSSNATPSGVALCAALLRLQSEQWTRRRLLQRQLHDGAALRISALTLQLGLVRHEVTGLEPALHETIVGLQDELHAVLQELRAVEHDIYPALLDEAGLGPALTELAERTGSVRVSATSERFDPAIEGAAYFAVAQCLGSRPPGAPSVSVVVDRAGDRLIVEVAGTELLHVDTVRGLLQHLDGTVDVAGGPEVGTITARLACA
ncbi:histidine kinase [Pseudonocardia sp. 73-21]|mgnify:CR=1 FL=1|uniref:histidine kinase dimerization/phosphoacceptor domain-containing protein n=1 Tax=Pseudonocardia sp. 73-21 TaxID=1895809 RepID=UPI0009635554|nr:histidine kinase [Pseudonocardia sp. 73-21]OJY48897.1 MAG: hypothetical protein BGP03_08935 [Pseudonocardia sp. 73-21]